MKAKLKGAQIGHDLLKRKSEALTKYVHPDDNLDRLLTRMCRRFRGMQYPAIVEMFF